MQTYVDARQFGEGEEQGERFVYVCERERVRVPLQLYKYKYAKLT
jgi:hypothetical protein